MEPEDPKEDSEEYEKADDFNPLDHEYRDDPQGGEPEDDGQADDESGEEREQEDLNISGWEDDGDEGEEEVP